MKTGKLVKNRKNKSIFEYEGKSYTYDGIYNLIKQLNYHKTGEDCDWNIIRVHDIKENKDCCCVAFQQSTTKEDWFHNFDFFPKAVKAYKGWKNKLIYHEGFYKEYKSARDEIKLALSKSLNELAEEQKCKVSDLKLYVIGWSLGASIAPIAMEDFHEEFGINPVCILFEGANPCESFHTRKYLMSCMNLDESISFVYSNDVVCRCPPLLGRQFKDIIYYNNDHKCKFPFYLIKKLISFIKDTEYYHTHADEGILKYMPFEE